MVVEGGGSYIHTVSMAAGEDRLIVAWSDASGTHVQGLSFTGEPLGHVIKVAPPSKSIQVSKTPAGFVLGILHPGHVIWGGGTTTIVHLDRQGNPSGLRDILGRAGFFSKGIAVVGGHEAPVAVWQDGVPSELSVKLGVGRGSPAIRLSSLRRNGCCPDLVSLGDSLLATWGEFRVEDPRSWVMAQRFSLKGKSLEPPWIVTRSKVPQPWPALSATKDGFALIYRDAPESSEKEDLYFMRYRHPRQRVVAPLKLGRYDGPTRGRLLVSGDIFLSVAVRSWSREQILGIDRFDWGGQRIGAEMHVFFDHLRLTDADVVQLGTRYLLLFAEDNPSQKIWLAEVRCR